MPFLVFLNASLYTPVSELTTSFEILGAFFLLLIITLDSFLQFANAENPMLFKFLGKVIFFKDLYCQNAPSPIVFTVGGILIDFI